jgi:cytochrome c-type biogenesis protein CcsB
MTSFWNTLFSSKIAMLFLILFIIIIGSATFIENSYDTATAQQLIYNAGWFELLMLVLVILYIIMMFRKGLLHKEKIPQLVFHFSFVVLFFGGGITRYFGFEANMHILENEAVNELYSAEPYLQIKANNGTIDYSSDSPLYFSQIENNDFHLEFDIIKGEKLEINYKNYIFKAKDSFELYGTEEEKTDYQSRNPGLDSPDALMATITYKGKTHEAILFYDDTKYVQKFKPFYLEGLQLEITYGPKSIDLPFAIQLKDFILSKYPGTNIPSASESRVQLIDERISLSEEHLIAKNKVLDYDGYRFFQTSYDDDEKGTILSVNYDYYGTRITYLGYILMILGAILILFSKRSHFYQLDVKIKEVRGRRKSLYLSIVLVVGFQSFSFSQNSIQNPINVEHADHFGHLLVQTYDGRFSSVHSLATDVVHKISGKEEFNIEGKGTMVAMQLFLDILVDPEFWRVQKIILIREKSLRNILGVSGKYASFNDFHENNKYKLEALAQRAFHKKASDQSTLDREIIKVTERVNIFLMILKGTMLKLFPDQNSKNNEWISWIDERSFKPLSGELLMLNEDLKLKDFSYSNIMRSYLISTINARESNDYAIPDKLMGYIRSIQRQLSPVELIPSESKIELEVMYNKLKIFDLLKYVYALLGIGLLILTFVKNFNSKSSKKIQLAINILISFIFTAFLSQTVGIGLRWYLGGHAPWSNGYEVLLLIAWGSILAGFYVIKYSKITLASTALLAFLILMTAGHSYYDPQLTNLNPVLKSYWLIIHVAIITIGYGFLGLSFLLGLINIAIHLFKTKKKAVISSLVIEELTYINEKLLTIGMFLTVIGTFIGCIWANESWGSYWSWNAKQTWSLIIVLVYAVVLHFKYIPKMKSFLAFNIGAVISFGSVLMTFIGVNYYFTKGLHSYASDDPPIFPVWAWIAIIALIALIISAVIKENYWKKEVRV